MSEIRKYITLIESYENQSLHPLEIAILDEWDDGYEDLDELIDDEGLDDVLDALLNGNMREEANYLLNHQNISGKVHHSHGEDKAAIYALSNNMAIVRGSDGSTYYVYNDPESLVYDFDDDYLFSFFNYDPIRESKDFWASVTDNTYAYHATNEDKVEGILQNGLEPRSDSRGLANKSTGAAVFTTLNVDELDVGTYGDVHFKIHLGEMKKRGYMPYVMPEEPLIVDKYRSVIASMFDLEYDFGNSDLSHDTLVIFGKIPPDYLEIIS